MESLEDKVTHKPSECEMLLRITTIILSFLLFLWFTQSLSLDFVPFEPQNNATANVIIPILEKENKFRGVVTC